MTSSGLFVGACLLALIGSTATAAAQVDPGEPPRDPTAPDVEPELAIGVRMVTSINGVRSDTGSNSSAIDFSDTYVFLRPRITQFSSGLRAGALFALTAPDAYAEPGTLFLADANAFLDHRYGTLRIGRGRLKSRLIPIPTLRDDDLIRYTDVANPFSAGVSTADLQFGNTADLTLWPTPRHYVELHAENLASTTLPPDQAEAEAFRINSYGLTAGFRQIPALALLSAIRQLAVGVNTYHVRAPGQAWTADATAGAWFGLLIDPIHSVDLRMQATYSLGIDGTVLDTPAAEQRARAAAGVASIGYTYRRRLLPAWRTNVMGGYRRYTAVELEQWSLGANVFRAIGTSVEVGVQYQFQRRDGGIPSAFGDDQEHSIKVALTGSFETIFGRLFDERDSLLNTQGGYLP